MNDVIQTIITVAIASLVPLSVAATCAWWKWRVKRIEFLWAMAINHYVETGVKTEAFSTVPRAYAKAAERKRVALVCERSREIRPFEAQCTCPSCTFVGVHYMTARARVPADRMVERECVSCGYTWRQR